MGLHVKDNRAGQRDLFVDAQPAAARDHRVQGEGVCVPAAEKFVAEKAEKKRRIKKIVRAVSKDPDLVKKVWLDVAGFSEMGRGFSKGRGFTKLAEVGKREAACHIFGIERFLKLLKHTRDEPHLRDRIFVRGVKLSRFFGRNADVMSRELKDEGGELQSKAGVYMRAMVLSSRGDLRQHWQSKDGETVYAECEARDLVGNKVRIQIEDGEALEAFRRIFKDSANAGFEDKDLFICSPAVYACHQDDDAGLAVIVTHPHQFMDVEPGRDIR